MRAWQVERRKRTRHLIELGGLVVKAGIVELTNDDRALIYGAMLWVADKLNSEEGERARKLWTKKGKEALKAKRIDDVDCYRRSDFRLRRTKGFEGKNWHSR